ncbi:hypothetical protein IAT38_002203 [Cryptococcus sp. DSM 104549]
MASKAGPSYENPIDLTQDYDVPPPSRIRLKETAAEKAERIYRREQRRQAKETDRISRANGYAVSPPRASRQESMSPPRRAAKPRGGSVDDPLDEGEWMGGFGRRAKEELEKKEWEDKMRWMAGDGGDPFGDPTGAGYGHAGVPADDLHIPKRFRPAHPTSHARRNAADEVHLSGGGVPALGQMTEEEYAEWVRAGMHARKHKDEIRAAEARRAAAKEKERVRQLERERVERIERERIRQHAKEERARKEEAERKAREQQQKHWEWWEGSERARQSRAGAGPSAWFFGGAGADAGPTAGVDGSLLDDPARWKARWASLADVGGEIEEIQLRFDDIPWPIFRSSIPRGSTPLDALTDVNVRAYMRAVAAAPDSGATGPTAGGGSTLRKTVREAIRNFHPDRFHGRMLLRVREKDRETVREGVEKVSRVLNSLAAETK